MSQVTNLIVLACGSIDDTAWLSEQLNRYWDNPDVFGAGLDRLVWVEDPSLPPHWYGGGKNLEALVFVGAFNHLDLDAFFAHLNAIEWPEVYKDCFLQVCVQEQDDDLFRLIDIRRPSWAQVV
jgi:hypothetical protein